MVMCDGFVTALSVTKNITSVIRHDVVLQKSIVHQAWERTVSELAQPLMLRTGAAPPNRGVRGRIATPTTFTPRSVACRTIRALLSTLWDNGGRGLNLTLAVRESAWTPDRHIFVCTEETCKTVRLLLLHFCRVLGTSAGSAFVKSVVARALGEWPQEEAEKRQRRFDMVLSWRALQTGNDVV